MPELPAEFSHAGQPPPSIRAVFQQTPDASEIPPTPSKTSFLRRHGARLLSTFVFCAFVHCESVSPTHLNFYTTKYGVNLPFHDVSEPLSRPVTAPC